MLGALVVVAWFIQSFFLNYTVDDAFITFRYSRNLANGLGLVFNPGEKVEGFTNFLWTLYCSIPFLLGVDVLWFSKITLMLLSAGSLTLAVLLLRTFGGRTTWWFPHLVGVLLATNTSFTVYAVNGIETGLFVFLLLLALLLSARECAKGGWVSAIPWALLFLTRPDGLLFFGIIWLARLLFFKRGRHFWLWTAVYAGIVIPYTAFRLAYFGYPFPNTYYVKTAGSLADRVGRWGLRYFSDMLAVVPNWFYLFLPMAGAPFVWRRVPRLARVLVALPYIYLGYVLYVGGDINFPHFRFLLHVLPLMAVVGLLPLAAQARAGGRKIGGSTVKLAGAVLLVLATAILQVNHTISVWRSLNRGSESIRYRYMHVTPLAGLVSIYPTIGEYLKTACPPGSKVVMQDVGAIPFYSNVVTIDIIGLVNAELAHYFYEEGYSDYMRSKLPVEMVLEVDANVRDYIMEKQQADFILYHVDSGDASDLRYSFHFHNLAFDPRFSLLYEPVAEFRYPRSGLVDHILFQRMGESAVP